MTTKDIGALRALRQQLAQATRQSGYSSLGRRYPTASAARQLVRCRAQVERYVASHQRDAEGWRLMALAEETLLNYEAAIRCMETAIAISGTPDRRDLKRLASCQEQRDWWVRLRLTPLQLRDLGHHLSEVAGDLEATHSFAFTENWLRQRGLPVDDVLAALRSLGISSDREVLWNVTLE